MKKNIRTKITFVFFCIFFSPLASCINNAPPPPPEEDPLYQAINSGSGSIVGRPAAPAALLSNDNPPANAATPNFSAANNPATISTAAQNGPDGIPEATPQTAAAPQNAPYVNPYANVAAAPVVAQPNNPIPIFVPQIKTNPQVAPEPEYDFSQVGCSPSENSIRLILVEIKKKKSEVFRTLPDCLKLDRSLMMRAAIIDPSEFQYAADLLKEDESFVHRMLEINPEVLKFASASLRLDPAFMEEATYLNRNALQYADAKLLNNKIFIRNMIKIDPQNYMFASERLKKIPEFAEMAFVDDGTLLQYAPLEIKSDKKLVTIAVKSNNEALQYASDKLKEDKDLKKLAAKKSSIKSEEALKKFMVENYINDSDKKNIGIIIDNRMKFFGENKLIDRNYVTKWQRSYDTSNDNLRLISADSRNFPVLWKDDFKKFPLLAARIESFFRNHQVDQSTIDSLKTVYFWKVKKKPQTVVFNLYLLRDSKDAELGPKFGNVSSLTAIAQKQGEKWHLSVVEVIFDSEMKIDLAYENGHKKYVLWDLYKDDKNDKNPKIIFKVEDKFGEYFEIFEEKNNGKYRMAYRVDSLKDATIEPEKPKIEIGDENSF